MSREGSPNHLIPDEGKTDDAAPSHARLAHAELESALVERLVPQLVPVLTEHFLPTLTMALQQAMLDYTTRLTSVSTPTATVTAPIPGTPDSRHVTRRLPHPTEASVHVSSFSPGEQTSTTTVSHTVPTPVAVTGPIPMVVTSMPMSTSIPNPTSMSPSTPPSHTPLVASTTVTQPLPYAQGIMDTLEENMMAAATSAARNQSLYRGTHPDDFAVDDVWTPRRVSMDVSERRLSPVPSVRSVTLTPEEMKLAKPFTGGDQNVLRWLFAFDGLANTRRWNAEQRKLVLRNLLVPGPGEDWFLGSHINLDEISLTEFVRRFVGAFTHGGYEQELRYEMSYCDMARCCDVS